MQPSNFHLTLVLPFSRLQSNLGLSSGLSALCVENLSILPGKGNAVLSTVVFQQTHISCIDI